MAVKQIFFCDECNEQPARPLIVTRSLELDGWGTLMFGAHFCSAGCLVKALHKALVLGIEPSEVVQK